METKDILKQATDKGLCHEFQERMKSDLSLKNLCDMYFEGDDWSMKNDFPNLETLRNFKGKSEVYRLFTDYVGMPNNLSKAAFFGTSDVKLIYNGCTASQLVLRHEAKAKISVTDNAFLAINILDSAEVEIQVSAYARVLVYNYNNCKVTYTGDVTITKSKLE